MSDRMLLTREIKSNRKIPLPAVVRSLLVRDPSNPTVAWNYYKDDIIALSNDPLIRDEHDDYSWIKVTDVMDDGRYIRPPDDIDDELLQHFQPGETRVADVLKEWARKDVDVIERWSKHQLPYDQDETDSMLNAEVRNTVAFLVDERFFSENTNIVFLLTQEQAAETLPDSIDALLEDASMPDSVTSIGTEFDGLRDDIALDTWPDDSVEITVGEEEDNGASE